MHHTKLFWILIGAMAFAAVPANAQQAPAITSASAASFPAGIADSFTVTTTGVPTPAITESGTLPHGVAFVDNGDGTATLSGTAAARGSFSIGITAANGVGSNAVQDFSLSVAKSASSTGLSSSATSSTYGQSMTFTATVTSESGAPSGTVKFYDDGALLGTATLSGESAAFSTAVSQRRQTHHQGNVLRQQSVRIQHRFGQANGAAGSHRNRDHERRSLPVHLWSGGHVHRDCQYIGRLGHGQCNVQRRWEGDRQRSPVRRNGEYDDDSDATHGRD